MAKAGHRRGQVKVRDRSSRAGPVQNQVRERTRAVPGEGQYRAWADLAQGKNKPAIGHDRARAWHG
jgi:hypothetical protein